jgi:putative Holliday junction resolvase
VKLLGIDYGTKRVGIASTDESGEYALPRAVVPNTPELAEQVLTIAREYHAERIVIGESKNFKGEDNPVMTEVRVFAAMLKEKGMDVVFHPELMTSMEAERLQGSNDMNDASAAALILKSYIDTN